MERGYGCEGTIRLSLCRGGDEGELVVNWVERRTVWMVVGAWCEGETELKTPEYTVVTTRSRHHSGG